MSRFKYYITPIAVAAALAFIIASTAFVLADDVSKQNNPPISPPSEASAKTNQLFDLSLEQLTDLPIANAPKQTQAEDSKQTGAMSEIATK